MSVVWEQHVTLLHWKLYVILPLNTPWLPPMSHLWMTNPCSCSWCRKGCCSGTPRWDHEGWAIKRLHRCVASGGGRADLNYSQHYRDQSGHSEGGHGRVSRNRESKLYGAAVNLWEGGQEIHHNSWECSQEIWALHCDSAKSATVIEKCCNVKRERVI